MSALLLEDNATREQLSAVKLWERVAYCKQHIQPIQSQYRVVYWNDDGDTSVLVPDPHWFAMAIRGDVVPTIDAYLEMPMILMFTNDPNMKEFISVSCKGAEAARVRKYWTEIEGFNYLGEKVNPQHKLHTAETMPPMTEEQAIEYLLMKDVPFEVWRNHEQRNSRNFVICTVSQVPENREYRNAWRLKQ